MASKKNWSEVEDVALLRQVSADLPFAAKHGAVMEAWNKLAMALVKLSDFERPNFDGKKAQNRFLALLEKHANDDKASARLSGASEAYKERRQLLDDLLR